MSTCVINDYIHLLLSVNPHIVVLDTTLTPCHVELPKQVLQHDSNDHSYSIQYDYKSSYKHFFIYKILQI
jgi:hypothetical protein